MGSEERRQQRIIRDSALKGQAGFRRWKHSTSKNDSDPRGCGAGSPGTLEGQAPRLSYSALDIQYPHAASWGAGVQ